MRRTICVFVIAFVCASSFGDAVTIDGKRYEDVLVRESPSRYYVWLPNEERTISVAKDKAQDVALTQDAGARGRLIQQWTEWQERQKAGASMKSQESPGDRAQPEANTQSAHAEASTAPTAPQSDVPGTAQAPPLHEIVAAYAEHQDRLLHFADTHELQEIVYSNPRHHPGRGKSAMFVEGAYAYDGTHFLNETQRWYDPPVDTATRENPAFSKALWDGSTMWCYGGRVARKPDGSLWADLDVTPNVRSCPKFGAYYFENPKYNFTVRNYHGREALGFLLFWNESDARRIDEVLTDTASVRVHPTPERLGDAECCVVDVDLPKSTLTVWFEPARQFNIPKAVWRYRPGSGEEDPEWRIRKWEEVYRVHDYMQTQDLWAPKETTQERHLEYANGGKEERVYHFRRLTLDVNPDFTARNTFTLRDKVDDGAHVSQGACAGTDPFTGEHRDMLVRQYVWKKGKLTPTKGPLLISKEAEGLNAPLLTEIP